jgi:hypothetical protein
MIALRFRFGSGHHLARHGQGDDFLFRKLCKSACGGEQRETERDTKND